MYYGAKHLLSQHPNYPSYGAAISIQTCRDIQDKYRYIIINYNNFRELLLLNFILKHCMGEKSGGGVLIQLVENRSLREESFFSLSKLWLVLLYWWCRQYPVTDTQSLMQQKRRMFLGCQQSMHSSTLRTPAAGG